MSSLNPAITIGNQVAEPIRIHQGASKAEALAKAEELLDPRLHSGRREPARLLST